MSKENGLINAQALAKELGLSVETIWRYTRERKIPYIDLGSRQYRYRLADVLQALNAPAVKEQTGNYEAGLEKKYTYQDYLEMPDEPGYRIEILDGILVKEPSPNVAHQRVSRRLQRILEDYFWQEDPEGEIFNAPLDVTFHDVTVVQPDLLYVAGTQKEIVQDTRIDGAPVLVVEVLSPSTTRKDRLQKLQIYQKAGVTHYWLVSPEEKTLECFQLRDGVYALVAGGLDDDVVEHPAFQGLSIPLSSLWK
ncbi:MAG TPA: helix-turn-helix domain-containing protein [Clostridia bacterium]|nr:helix-turn-helix domain-containing protein [Clostridia bacterium]